MGFLMRELIKSNAALIFSGIASFILMGAGQSIYGPALPAFSRLFDIGLGTAGFLVTAHWVGCAFGVGTMFWVGPRATPRHVIVAMILGAGLVATSLNFAVVILGAVLFGAGYGAATVVYNGRVLQVFGSGATGILSLMNACFGIGAIGAPLLFVALNNAPAPTFSLFAVAAVAIWFFSGRVTHPQPAATNAPKIPLKLDLPILTFHALAIGTEASLIGLGPAALMATGASEVWAAQLLSIFFIGFLLARVSLFFVAHLLPPFRISTLAVAGVGLSSLGAATLSPDVFFVIMGFCAGAFFPTVYVAATRRMGDNARVSPVIITAGLIGGILIPLVLSQVMRQMGQFGFFWLFAGLMAAMTLWAITYGRRYNR
jgi:FHS family glucose/mannose:H+ symporter-like MFS transporter